jgi:branched-chain amino acid transport system ATP-binding protein
VLELRQVSAGYAGTTVLRDVSLWLPPGKIVALLGPNGAGKTTTLRVGSGLIPCRHGGLYVDGRRQRASPFALARAGVSHMPEGRGVFPTLTVRENIVVQARGRAVGEAVERAVTAFPRLGERINQVAGTMSGGEQQMVALAKAYVSDARYVLLDEVSMGLAPLIVDEIFAFLRRLADEGRALLLVEQYVTRALELADYVYLLNRGEVTFRGEPGELAGDDLFASYVGVALGGH